MGVHQLRMWQFRCDGFTPQGKPCEGGTTVHAVTRFDAEQQVRGLRRQAWYQDARGWMCGHPQGHRGDR